MNKNIFIPEKLKVGFQERTDTYTKKLGYVIYQKDKKWRKEPSWNNWRNKDIPHIEIDNKPTEGFVLNKKVGGVKYDWNYRDAYCRVYHPEGFEFEISIPNLLYILQNTNSIKGKGLEGKLIFGWEGTELVLIPEQSPEYQDMLNFTDLQKEVVKKANLIKGGIYLDNNNQEVTYINYDFTYSYSSIKSKNKSLIFHSEGGFHSKALSSIKRYTGKINDKYSDILESTITAYNYKPFVKFESVYTLVKFEANNPYYYANNNYYMLKDNKYFPVRVRIGWSNKGYIESKGYQEEFSTINELNTKFQLYELETKDVTEYVYEPIDVDTTSIRTGGYPYTLYPNNIYMNLNGVMTLVRYINYDINKSMTINIQEQKSLTYLLGDFLLLTFYKKKFKSYGN